VLLAAEEWGVPPWEIAGGAKYLWFTRWNFFRGQVNKKQAGEARKWQTKSR
jgi:hypothetical protein